MVLRQVKTVSTMASLGAGIFEVLAGYIRLALSTVTLAVPCKKMLHMTRVAKHDHGRAEQCLCCMLYRRLVSNHPMYSVRPKA